MKFSEALTERLKKNGYTFCPRINTWRKYECEDYLSNYIEVDLPRKHISVGWQNEWLEKEIDKILRIEEPDQGGNINRLYVGSFKITEWEAR